MEIFNLSKENKSGGDFSLLLSVRILIPMFFERISLSSKQDDSKFIDSIYFQRRSVFKSADVKERKMLSKY